LTYFVICDAFTEEVLAESYISSPMKIINKIQNREGIIFSNLDLKRIDRLRQHYKDLC